MSEYQLSPSILRRDGGTQPRAALDETIIQEYADALRAGDTFPAVVAFHDGAAYWLADGFHRVNAALRAGVTLLQVDVRQGSQRDAILYSAGVNATHGLRRTNEDKRRAVTRLLSDPEWSQWSDREIGRRCAVTHPFVSAIRSELSGNGYQIDARRVTRGGTEYTMQTATIGQPAQSEQIGRLPANQANAPIWEIESAIYGYLRETIQLEDGADWLAQAETILLDLRDNRQRSERWTTVAGLVPCRLGDLVQAINNTLEQVHHAQRRQGAAVAVVGDPGELPDAETVTDSTDWVGVHIDAPARTLRLDIRDADVDAPPALDEPDEPATPPARADTLRVNIRTAAASNGHEPPVVNSVDPVDTDSCQFPGPVTVGNVTIHQGDARDLATILSRQLGRRGVDLIITSPPYNTGGQIEYDGHGDNLPAHEYFDLLADVFRACYAVMNPGARLCVNVPFGMGRQPWVPLAGPVADLLTGGSGGALQLEGQIIWDKATTGNRTTWGSWRRPTNPSLRDTCEAVIIARKLGEMPLPAGVLVPDGEGPDVSPWLPADMFMALTQDHWQIAPESALRVGHPAPFPVKLAEGLLRLYGWPGCSVLDPFAGAGTVAVAALGLPGGSGCTVTLIDQSARYCLLAADRVRKTAVRLPA
jgi:DNA modification methylase